MADLEEFRLVSGARSGLKREFVFALKSQAELAGLIGRTRVRKTQMESLSPVLKRFKGSGDMQVDEVKKSDEVIRGLADLVEKSVIREDLVGESVIKEDFGGEIARDEKISGESGVVIDDVKCEVENGLLKSPLRRFTRSRSRSVHAEALEVNRKVDDSEDIKVDLGKLSVKKDAEVPVVIDLVKSPVKNGFEEPVVVDLAKSPLKKDLEVPVVNDCAKKDCEAPVVIDGNLESLNGLMETPPSRRRFTRSVLKPKAKVEEMAVSATSSGSSVVSDDACRNEAVRKDNVKMFDADVVSPFKTPPPQKNKLEFKMSKRNEAITKDNGKVLDVDVVSSFKTPPPQKNKLEMKMSKKIGLTKFPTSAKELLATGLLEGLSVTYVHKNMKVKRESLAGMVKDDAILCSCSSCNWSKTVSVYQFEKHAGSTNKHPLDYMYLENGTKLRDVLDACKDAPLDTLEATIKNSLSSSPVKVAMVCRNCKGPLPASHTPKFRSLCNSCLASKKAEESPVCTTASKRRSSKAVASPRSFGSVCKSISPKIMKRKGKLTTKDLRLHKLAFEADGLPDGTELGYYVRGKKLLEGFKKGFGIFCCCCNKVVSASSFEAHAGWATRRKPYLNIYTSNGVSLHELSVSLSRGRKFSPTENDDLCSICAEFGELLLCDGCPRAFHQGCLGLSSIPRGKWYCKYCLSMYEREKACQYNENAKAAGRVAGVDPIEQITQRCIRIVEMLETEAGGCTLCRHDGFTKSGFGPLTVILCDQCENEYHVGCLKSHHMADLRELPQGNWFCSAGCTRIHTAMQKLVNHGSDKLSNSLYEIIKKKQKNETDVKVRWRVLSGKTAVPEGKLWLSKAVALFHDRFDPIVDVKTGHDLIPSMVYGKTIRDQDFAGMYCAILTVDTTVVSAVILRIFGQVAEIPLVATNTDYQGQGYFQSLFYCLERLLGFLNVINIVLPAAEEAESIWTNKFGFKKMTPDELTELRKRSQIMTFQGTSMLQKPAPRVRVIPKESKDS